MISNSSILVCNLILKYETETLYFQTIVKYHDLFFFVVNYSFWLRFNVSFIYIKIFYIIAPLGLKSIILLIFVSNLYLSLGDKRRYSDSDKFFSSGIQDETFFLFLCQHNLWFVAFKNLNHICG